MDLVWASFCFNDSLVRKVSVSPSLNEEMDVQRLIELNAQGARHGQHLMQVLEDGDEGYSLVLLHISPLTLPGVPWPPPR